MALRNEQLNFGGYLDHLDPQCKIYPFFLPSDFCLLGRYGDFSSLTSLMSFCYIKVVQDKHLKILGEVGISLKSLRKSRFTLLLSLPTRVCFCLHLLVSRLSYRQNFLSFRRGGKWPKEKCVGRDAGRLHPGF